MTLSPGTKLGPYEILAPLGAGGMGALSLGWVAGLPEKMHRKGDVK